MPRGLRELAKLFSSNRVVTSTPLTLNFVPFHSKTSLLQASTCCLRRLVKCLEHWFYFSFLSSSGASPMDYLLNFPCIYYSYSHSCCPSLILHFSWKSNISLLPSSIPE